MKPIKLYIEGIKSFRNAQEIDFTKLTRKGVFGIVGPSGSGKSTILDSIVIALYGKDSRSKTNAEFINSKSNKAKVVLEFEFTLDGKTKTYEVERVFYRSKKDPNVVTSEAQVFEKQGANKRQVAESVYKTDAYIKELLSMSEVEFSKCIALPQGEFAGFLKAKPSERVAIIGNLFDLDVYGQKLWDKLSVKKNKIEEDAKITLAKLELVNSVSEEEILSIKAEIDNIKSRVKEIDERVDFLRNKKGDLDLAFKSRERRKELEKIIEELNSKSAEINEKKSLIERSLKLQKYSASYSTREMVTKKIKQVDIEIDKETVEKQKLVQVYNEKKKLYDDYVDEINAEIEEMSKKYTFLLALKDKFPRLAELKEESKTLKKELSEFVLNKSRAQDEITKIENKIKEYENEKTRQYEIIAPVNDRAKTYLDLIDIQDYSKQIKLLSDFSLAINNLKEARLRESGQATKDLFNISKKEKQLKEKVDEISTSVGSFLNDHTSNSYEKLRKLDYKYNEILSAKSKIEFLNKYVQALDIENDELIENLKNLEDEGIRAQDNIAKADKIVNQIKLDIEKEQEEKEAYFGANTLSVLLEHVNIGDECPICKSDVIQKRLVKKTDLDVFDKNIDSLKVKKQTAEAERDKILFLIAKIEIEKELNRTRIEFNKKKQKSLLNDIDAEYIKFVDLNNEKEVNFVNYLETTRSSIEKIELLIKMEEELKGKIKEIEDNRIELGTKIMICKDMAEEFISIHDIFEAEKAERELFVYSIVGKKQSITESLEELRDDYLIYKKANEEIETIDENIRGLNEEKNDRIIELSKLDSDSFKCFTKYESITGEIDSIESDIKRETYGDFDEYLQSVQSQLTNKKEKLEKDRLEVVNLDSLIAKKNDLILNKNELKNEYQRQIDEIDRSLAAVYSELNISSLEDKNKYNISESQREELLREVENYNSSLSVAQTELNNLNNMGNIDFNEVDFYNLSSELQEGEKTSGELREKLGNLSHLLETKETDLSKKKVLIEEYQKTESKLNLLKELSELFKGKALLEYVAEEYIDDITKIASKKLMTLKNGEYSLVCENKEFFVIDNLDDGFKRSTSTLSGGETFVVSLALALAMSEAIIMSSNRSFDFFFLDEGFGTLDSELCHTIINALFKLEKQKLTIGLISHVKELQELINYKLLVKKRTESQGSTLEYEFTI